MKEITRDNDKLSVLHLFIHSANIIEHLLEAFSREAALSKADNNSCSHEVWSLVGGAK